MKEHLLLIFLLNVLLINSTVVIWWVKKTSFDKESNTGAVQLSLASRLTIFKQTWRQRQLHFCDTASRMPLSLATVEKQSWFQSQLRQDEDSDRETDKNHKDECTTCANKCPFTCSDASFSFPSILFLQFVCRLITVAGTLPKG